MGQSISPIVLAQEVQWEQTGDPTIALELSDREYATQLWAEFVDAVDRMFEKKMTRYSSLTAYRPYDIVARQEAAKFFSVFSKEILLSVIDVSKYCAFTDLDDADPTLKNAILESCLLNLFQWSAWRFNPNDQFTKVQALAVLVRALDWFRSESGAVRREEYYTQAYQWGLTVVTDREQLLNPITRYEMAVLLHRAQAIAALLESERIAAMLDEDGEPGADLSVSEQIQAALGN